MSWVGYFLKAGIDPRNLSGLEFTTSPIFKKNITVEGEAKLSGVTKDRYGSVVMPVSTVYNTALADDAKIALPKVAGLLLVTIGASDYGIMTVAANGTVTKVAGSANMVNTDTDTKACVFKDTGDVPTIRNRLGSAAAVYGVFFHTTVLA